MANKYFWCPACGRQFVSREFAKKCHGIDPARDKPVEKKKPTTGFVGRMVKDEVVLRAKNLPKAVQEMLVPKAKQYLTATVPLAKVPDGACKTCLIARQHGTVIFCRCMVKTQM